MIPKIPEAEVGVIVARFQGPELHEMQHDLIKTVMKNHKKVMILLGNSVTKVTRNNPLDFFTRKLMVNTEYPDVVVLPVRDMGSDEAWSNGVDAQIRSAFDMETVVIYGSRDSFIKHYSGKFPTVDLESSHPNLSGTEIRKMISETVRSSYDFRAGLIYAAYNKYPIVYPTVDAVIYNAKTEEILLGRKRTDAKDKYRLPGGFVSPEDMSKEEAVVREAHEETGYIAEIGTVKYIASIRVEDYRYKKEVDKILTTLYLVPYTYGMVKAADDLDDLKWFKLDTILKNDGYQLVDEHKPFVALLKTYFKKEL